VLLDIAALKGVDMLPDDYMITVADLRAAMKQANVDVRKRDAVLIRTGWGRLWMVDNARFIKGEPGIGLEAAEFLVKRNVMRSAPTTGPSRCDPIRTRTSSCRCTAFCSTSTASI
jgi:kynurenine formamidase